MAKEYQPQVSIGSAAHQIEEYVSDVTLLYSYVGALLKMNLVDEKVKDTLQSNYDRVAKHYSV